MIIIEIQTGSLNLSQMTRPCNNQQKKRTCQIVDSANCGLCNPKDKFPDLTRELKKLWNIKVMIISIVIGGLGTVTKGLVLGQENLEIRGHVETIQTTALLRSARKLKRISEI